MLKINIELEVESCSGCPLRYHSRGHGENWFECKHPDSPSGYEKIIDTRFERIGTPDWCPAKEEEVK